MKIYKIIILIIILAIIGFVLPWIYSRYSSYFDSEKLQTNSNNFYLAASAPKIELYPFRNWQEGEPNFNGEIALISDIDTGFIFFQKNPDMRRPIASVSKLMTSLIVNKHFNLQDKIQIKKEFLNIEGDSKTDLQIGEILSVSDLNKLLILLSSNKSAIALASNAKNNNFIYLMNQEAKELNMTRTSFVEPSGLSMANQSSANDLERLAKYILKNYSEIFLLSQEKQTDIFIEYNNGNNINYSIKNINQMAGESQFLKDLNIKYLGGKTGFTDEARETYLGIFSVPSKRFAGQSRRILIIVLNSPTRYNDIENLLLWLKDAYVF